MNIQPTNYLSFEAVKPKIKAIKTKFYVPGQNDTTLRCNSQRTEDKITKLKYEVLKKGKIIEKEQFSNKNGIDSYSFAEISEKIQKKVRDGFDFLDEFFNAQFKGGN